MKITTVPLLAAAIALGVSSATADEIAQKGGFDPDAGRLLAQILKENEFGPGTIAGSGAGSVLPGAVFQHKVPAQSEEESILKRTTELFGLLKSSDFAFVTPKERSENLADMRTYASLRPYCQGYPIKYADLQAGSSFDSETRPLLELAQAPRSRVAPYVANSPRPIDYELVYPLRSPLAIATEGFALYQIPTGDDGNVLYVLRSDSYAIPSDGDVRKEPGLSDWGRFTAFRHPDCTFRGSVVFRSECKTKTGRDIQRLYLSEIVKIDGEHFALTAWQMYCKTEGSRYVDQPTIYRLVLWDLGESNDNGGRMYYLGTDLSQ